MACFKLKVLAERSKLTLYSIDAKANTIKSVFGGVDFGYLKVIVLAKLYESEKTKFAKPK